MFATPAYHRFGQKTFKEREDRPPSPGAPPALRQALEEFHAHKLYRKAEVFFPKTIALQAALYGAVNTAVVLLPGLALCHNNNNFMRSTMILCMLCQWTVILQFCAPAVYNPPPAFRHRSGTLVRLANIAHIALLFWTLRDPSDVMLVAVGCSFAALWCVDRFSPRIYYAELYVVLLAASMLPNPAHCVRVLLGSYYFHCGANKATPNFVQFCTVPGLAYNSSILNLFLPREWFFDMRSPQQPAAKPALYAALLPAVLLECAGVLLVFERTMWVGWAAALAAHVGIIGLNVLPGAMAWNAASALALVALAFELQSTPTMVAGAGADAAFAAVCAYAAAAPLVAQWFDWGRFAQWQIYGDFSRYHEQIVFTRRDAALPFPFDEILTRVKLEYEDYAVQSAMRAIDVEGWETWEKLPALAGCRSLEEFFSQYDTSPNIGFMGPGACGNDDYLTCDVTPPLFDAAAPKPDRFFVVSIGNGTFWGRKRRVEIFDARGTLRLSSFEGGWGAEHWYSSSKATKAD